MSDRFRIDVHIAPQKMFCLRIVCSAERPFDKNLQTTCRGEEPKNKAQQECERQNPGSGGGPLRRSWLFSKVERSFFESVCVPDHQDGNEAEHAPKDRAALFDRVTIHDGPRVHKYDLQVEQNEKHCYEIKLNTKAWLPFTLRNHSAFVGHVFSWSASSAFTYQDADEQRGNCEQSDNNDLQEDRQIVAQHPEI